MFSWIFFLKTLIDTHLSHFARKYQIINLKYRLTSDTCISDYPMIREKDFPKNITFSPYDEHVPHLKLWWRLPSGFICWRFVKTCQFIFAIISPVRGNKWCVFKRPESYDFLISKNVLVVTLVLEKKWTLYTFGQTYRKHTAGD